MKDIVGIEHAIAILKPHWNDIEADFNRHNEKYLKLVTADHDPIGRVLRAHLVIENFLDTFLISHFGFDNFEQARLSYYQKAILLPAHASSAAFVRPGILQLNSIRNKFGHRINHEIADKEVSEIYEVLQFARNGVDFESPLDAVEAFAPIACAFLSVPPKHLHELFMSAFSMIKSNVPKAVVAE